MAGLATTYGSGAMSNSMDDLLASSQAFFVIGSNTTEQHPVFGTRLRQAVRQRGARLIVADPRRIDLTDYATLHLRQNPGTDIPLLNGLMYLILEQGGEDTGFIAARTEGFDDFRESIRSYPPEKVAALTGIAEEQLREAATILATCKPAAVIWAMGITQHIVGVRNVMALANLQMLLGNIGVPGGGVNPLRGQNNVQGACDMGALPNVHSGYQSVTAPEIAAKFAAAWGVSGSDRGGLPLQAGLTATEMIPGTIDGRVKALFVLGEDPVMSDPNTHHVRECLAAVELLVLQDIFPSETSAYADVLLPGASFAEKTGTFTNTERRVQLVRQAIEPLGDAKPDWWITAELARRLLARLPDRVDAKAPWAGWDYPDSAAVMAEINALTPSYGGITHARLAAGARLQWPCPNGEHPGTPILHVDAFTRGKGRFMPIDHLPPAEQPDDDFPMVMTTGRVLYHWHGGAITRRAEGLMQVYGETLIEVNPDDALRLGIAAESQVRVASRRGQIEARAWLTERVPPGVVYANFHFPEASANELTQAALDPIAKIPEFKVTAVRVSAV